MNLAQLFDLSLAGRRDSAALEFGGSVFTFGELDARSNRMAHALARRGLEQGDRLCCQLANSVDVIDLYLACVKLGVIYVPVNVLYKDREASHIIANAEPKAFVTRNEIDALAREAAGMPADATGTAFDGDAPAAIVYTSGTTGTSKGAVLTHNNFAANAVNLIAIWQITASDRLLMPLPLFHVHGLGNALHCWLISGLRMRLLERFEHETAAQQFQQFQPTLFFGVPAMYVRMLDWPVDTAREAGHRMRLFVSGSAPLPVHVLEAFRERFGHTILERYGMTETLMNISNPYIGERRAGTVGTPLPGVSVKIVDKELHVRGPNVFPGYWRNDQATRDAFVDGWFRTGDIASVSEDGYYTLLGRSSDLIISGGFNIYPREIEEFLQEQPEVAEAAVVGVADRVRGEVPVAYVVCHDDFDPACLEDRCRNALASFKVPRGFHRVPELPRTALGKVQKHLLGAGPGAKR